MARQGIGLTKDSFRRSRVYGYGLAIVAWAMAFVVRFLLSDWFPPGFPYLTFFPAVVVVAYFAGVRPAILTAVLSGLTAWWFWIGTAGFDLGPATAVALGFYVAVVTVDIFFIVGMDSATRRLAVEVERSAALANSRNLLLKEVQHRVSNNIQVVSALLRLEASATQDPGARRALDEASARTATIARIQHGLADVDGRATPFDSFARPIVSDALAAAGRTNVTFEIAPTTIALDAEEATPVMLTMLECVNNALEHGLANRGGRIAITLADHAGERRLQVVDDGEGLKKDFALATSGSLGLRIIAGMARQLGGSFTLEDAHPGVVSRLAYPSPVTAGVGMPLSPLRSYTADQGPPRATQPGTTTTGQAMGPQRLVTR